MIKTKMNQSATCLAHLVRPDGDRYRPTLAYVEFANVVDPEDVVSPPSFDAADGVDYFAGLASPQDYLRVPLTWAPVESNDAAAYPDGNVAVALVIPLNGTGEGGLAFSPGSQSKVYGVTLVATPVPEDPTQDLQWCRCYLEEDEQFLHVVNGQSILRVRLPFTALT